MTARKRGALKEVSERPSAFALTFGALFLVLFGFLYLVGATPDSSSSVGSDEIPTSQSVAIATSTTPMNPEQPVRIVAKDINLNVSVSNPNTTDVTLLDNALELGAVRYPTSALLGVNGTVLIFGHSSYLPLINNLYYKTFDGIQNLKSGDIVSVYSNDTEYRYAVTGVKVVDANQAIIDLPDDAPHLTLVTCDSFALKTNRFVVTADFVGAYALNLGTSGGA
jgi:LPXTG-site transpeptidase (sortase) family protein